ncbi:MAG TPA: hypothetical protein VH880_08600 [Anaeromyxobacteraceae bacterium]
MSISLRLERTQRQGKITREFGDNGQSPGVIQDAVELAYSEVSNRILPRVTVGLWRDLELHLEIPYVLSAEPNWKYGTVGGASVEPTSAIANNAIDASGAACATTPCPMFPVGATLFGGAALDDLRVGVAWGVLTEKRDAWWPTWVVSLDVTAPTAARFDPAAGRLTAGGFFAPTSFSSSQRSAVGRKIWSWEIATAASRRMGAAEPYVRLRAVLPQRTNATYSNCEHATALAALGQMSSVAAGNCGLDAWKTLARAQPPAVYGFLFGVELAPYEDQGRGQRFAIDFRAGADFTTRGRWYNELTPATGKLLANSPYLTLAGQVALRLRTSRWLSLGLEGLFEKDLAHFITGDSMGRVDNEVVTPNSAQQNPNFDWRWDLPGRRFRITDTFSYRIALYAALGF